MAEHREEQDGSRVYHCRQCSLEFSKHSIYRDHMKQHNKVKYVLALYASMIFHLIYIQ